MRILDSPCCPPVHRPIGLAHRSSIEAPPPGVAGWPLGCGGGGGGDLPDTIPTEIIHLNPKLT